jgi:hypothetical protein
MLSKRTTRSPKMTQEPVSTVSLACYNPLRIPFAETLTRYNVVWRTISNLDEGSGPSG